MYVQCISSQNVRNWNIFKNIKLNNLNTVTGDKNNEILVPNSIRKCSGNCTNKIVTNLLFF